MIRIGKRSRSDEIERLFLTSAEIIEETGALALLLMTEEERETSGAKAKDCMLRERVYDMI